ncbi:MAG: PAS domain S-box protein, partial [Alphaproteobacteria bacterium]|nr:PAS domain S-box protein [Alphaproteobacteria bacterium]
MALAIQRSAAKERNAKPKKSNVFGFCSRETLHDLEAVIESINTSQAVIEFNLDGTIITANGNFLNAMGYSLEEIQGKHHSMFVEPGYAGS